MTAEARSKTREALFIVRSIQYLVSDDVGRQAEYVMDKHHVTELVQFTFRNALAPMASTTAGYRCERCAGIPWSRGLSLVALTGCQLYEITLDDLFKDRGESAKDIIKRLKSHMEVANRGSEKDLSRQEWRITLR
jgi:hypothetical protein